MPITSERWTHWRWDEPDRPTVTPNTDEPHTRVRFVRPVHVNFGPGWRGEFARAEEAEIPTRCLLELLQAKAIAPPSISSAPITAAEGRPADPARPGFIARVFGGVA